VLVLDDSCVGAPVWSGLWALLVSEMQDKIYYAFLLRSLVFFHAFHLWVPANHKSPKLVESIRIKPYSNIW
jgi:hypothetical protein